MIKPTRRFLHRIRVLDAVLFWPALAVVTWGQLTPASLPEGVQPGDKILHFIAYFGLAAMAAAAFKGRRPVAWAVLALIGLGGVLELVQGLIGRDASMLDEIANALGAATGGIVGRAVTEPLRRRFAEDANIRR